MTAAPERQALLTARLGLGLGLIALCQALALVWALAMPGSAVPLAGLLSMRMIPYLSCGLSMLIAAVAAPLLLHSSASTAASGGVQLGRMIFAALWQSAAAGYFLMLTARLSPVHPAGILRASLWLGASALACMLLAQVAKRNYAGWVFFWFIALPVSGYFLAEIFLMTPAGSSGWQQASGPQAQSIRAFTHALLSLSPATSAIGALTGTLPDGSEYSAGWPLAVICSVDVALGCWVWRGEKFSEASRPVPG